MFLLLQWDPHLQGRRVLRHRHRRCCCWLGVGCMNHQPLYDAVISWECLIDYRQRRSYSVQICWPAVTLLHVPRRYGFQDNSWVIVMFPIVELAVISAARDALPRLSAYPKRYWDKNLPCRTFSDVHEVTSRRDTDIGLGVAIRGTSNGDQ